MNGGCVPVMCSAVVVVRGKTDRVTCGYPQTIGAHMNLLSQSAQAVEHMGPLASRQRLLRWLPYWELAEDRAPVVGGPSDARVFTTPSTCGALSVSGSP